MITRFKPSLPSQGKNVQTRNKAGWNEHRPNNLADFYTIGYAGRTVAELYAVIEQAGVLTLIDIRHTPISMYKPEFNKTNLDEYFTSRGIHYLHLPHLGVPWDIRGEAIGEQGRGMIWQWYDSHVVQEFVRNLDFFFNAAEHPVALMCAELDPTACHRHRLCLALESCGLRGHDL